jgi:predicted dehydrogenase
MVEKKLAIIGAGAMGANHIRVASKNVDFELSHIVDGDIDRAQRAASEYGALAIQDINDLNLEDINAAIVAVPSYLHGFIGERLLSAGIHTLIEKPLSLNISEAEKLNKVALANDVQLMVGHIELFNPTITKLIEEIGGRAIRSISAERLGFVDDHSRLYHGVVDDLMLHDIAIARHILGPANAAQAKVLSATGRKDTASAPDPARAFVSFGDTDAYFYASRVYSGGKKRVVEVSLGDDTTLRADLLNRTVIRYHSEQEANQGVFSQKTTSLELRPVEAEPLQLEHTFFADIIDQKRTVEGSGVSAQDAIAILVLTEAINQSIQNLK